MTSVECHIRSHSGANRHPRLIEEGRKIVRDKKVGFGIAALVVLLSAVLGATVLREPIAWAASTPFQNVIVTNTTSQPVPVKQQGTADVREALWQGTPYIGHALSGRDCHEFSPAIPAGKILFAERVIVDFNVSPGQSGGAQMYFQPLGASSPSLFTIPVYPGPPASQVSGLNDSYGGVLELGLPTSTIPEACFGSSAFLAGDMRIIGYLVDAT